MKRVGLLLVAAALVAPLVAASPDLTYQAKSVQAAGSYDVSGQLLAFLQDPAMDVPGIAIRVEATTMRVEVDRTEASVRTGVVDVPVMPSTTPHNHTAAHLTEIEGRPGSRWILVPSPDASATLTGSCGSGRPPEGTYEREPRVYRERPTTIIDAHGGVEWVGCGAATHLQVIGSVLLVLWETDVKVGDASGTTTYWSGSRGDGRNPFLAQDQELWIYASDATVNLTIDNGGETHFLLAGGASAHSPAGLLLEQGAIPEIETAGREVRLDGDVTATMTWTEEILAGRITTPDAIVADGKRTELAGAVVAPTGTSMPWWLGVVALAALGLFAAARALPAHWFRSATRHGEVPPAYSAASSRHRRAGGYWLKAQEWLDRGWLRRARWASALATRLRPESTPHQLLRVAILDELGKDAAALKSLKAFYANASTPRERAIVALEVAASLARMGRRGEADEWLQHAQQDDPAAVAEAHQDAYFQAMHGRPAARRVHDADPSIA